MSQGKLGRLRKIDVREFWHGDRAEFTAWLLRDENLLLLGETIGVDLEVAAQEDPAKEDGVELLCRDTVSGQWVLVEAQIEGTGPEHLGRLIGQAASLNTTTVVWIAQSFCEEQRAALDWLNEITDSRYNFFGLEMELWQIADSPIAPKFNVVSKPNEWTKALPGSAGRFRPSSPTAAKELSQLEYWALFRERALHEGSVLRPPKAYPQNWMGFAIGRSNFRLVASINARRGVLVVSLLMDGPDAKAHFHLLRARRREIEDELGFALEWREQPAKKESIIAAETAEDPSDRTHWEVQHQWLLAHLEKFHAAFSGRIKSLDADEYDREPSAAPR
jgi:hypothetical protein